MHRHIPFFCRTLFAIGLVCQAVLVYAADAPTGTLKAIKDRRAVLVGYLKDAFPMSSLGTDGKPVGYSIDLCRVIAEQAGKAVGLDSVNSSMYRSRWTAASMRLRAARSTSNAARRRLPSRACEKVDFTSMTFLSGGSLLVKKGSAIRSVAALVDETVAVIPGTTTEKSLRDALARTYVKAKVIEVPDHAAGMAAIDSGKATAYASDRVLLIGLLVGSKTPDAYELAMEQFSSSPMVSWSVATMRISAWLPIARWLGSTGRGISGRSSSVGSGRSASPRLRCWACT